MTVSIQQNNFKPTNQQSKTESKAKENTNGITGVLDNFIPIIASADLFFPFAADTEADEFGLK
jgi:hypothetical protein